MQRWLDDLLTSGGKIAPHLIRQDNFSYPEAPMVAKSRNSIRHIIVATGAALVLGLAAAIAGGGSRAHAQQAVRTTADTVKLPACQIDLVAMARRNLGGGFGVTAEDYQKCVSDCDKKLDGPDQTTCIEGCRYISGFAGGRQAIILF